MYAATNGHLDVVALLLDRGANIEAANNVMRWQCWSFYVRFLLLFPVVSLLCITNSYVYPYPMSLILSSPRTLDCLLFFPLFYCFLGQCRGDRQCNEMTISESLLRFIIIACSCLMLFNPNRSLLILVFSFLTCLSMKYSNLLPIFNLSFFILASPQFSIRTTLGLT